MLETATKWLSWTCVVLTLVFAVCGFSAVFKWFDRDLADLIAKIAVGGLIAAVVALAACLMLQKLHDSSSCRFHSHRAPLDGSVLFRGQARRRWQLDGELGPLAGFALNGQGTTVRLDNLSRGRKSQTRTAWF